MTIRVPNIHVERNVNLVQLAPDESRLFAQRLEEIFKVNGQTIDLVMKYLRNVSQVQESVAANGVAGIRAGHFLHLRDNGQSAYLATSTISGTFWKLANAVCIDSLPSGKVYSVLMGSASGLCLPFTTSDTRLYLSSTPGWATDTEPAESSGQLSQEIAFKTGPINGSALCQIQLSIRGGHER